MIQSHQYIEEQGQNSNDLALFGQDSNGTVWSICIMNMILHNITSFTIENGDTLEDPMLLKNGQVRQFDRVLANPPFSQNYSRAGMKFPGRFREWCPETGKKADLMFVQHMLASLNPDGHMATIMPHGVLFRGGKEKLIREILINDNVIEAIIGLPPGLFYGTSIAACVFVCNKNKPDELRDKILFINADREYAEGKAQNKLRPEDIEEIDFVFTHKKEIPKYSRLVDKAEIVEKNDFDLNIRRYVDNTPDPEPEDVQAHLLGGIPEAEVAARAVDFARFCIDRDTLFAPLMEEGRAGYLAFCESIDSRQAIKASLENNPALQKALAAHFSALEGWWAAARDDFAQLQYARNGGKKLPEVRSDLMSGLKSQMVSLGVLDEFKRAGVFVNWWQQIRYDLKTIVSTGWHHSLIPDEYLIEEFFKAESSDIETLEASISEAQSELAEAVEMAQEVASYEPEEGEDKITAAVMKKALKELIEGLKESKSDLAKKEIRQLKDQEEIIKAIEKRIKEAKAKHKEKSANLEHKLKLKRLGGGDFKAESLAMIKQADAQLSGLDPENKMDKKKIKAINKDKEILAARISQTDAILADIGGQLSEEEARRVILMKIYDITHTELERYLNAEKRGLVQRVENLWDKYSVSSQELEVKRERTMNELNDFMNRLGYAP